MDYDGVSDEDNRGYDGVSGWGSGHCRSRGVKDSQDYRITEKYFVELSIVVAFSDQMTDYADIPQIDDDDDNEILTDEEFNFLDKFGAEFFLLPLLFKP